MKTSVPFGLSPCSESDYAPEFDYFLRGKESLRMGIRVSEVSGLMKEQVSTHAHANTHTHTHMHTHTHTHSHTHAHVHAYTHTLWYIVRVSYSAML